MLGSLFSNHPSASHKSRFNLDIGKIVSAMNDRELFCDAKSFARHPIQIDADSLSEKYCGGPASERLYSFKLGFARQMVDTLGRRSDYERLRTVQEDALNQLTPLGELC